MQKIGFNSPEEVEKEIRGEEGVAEMDHLKTPEQGSEKLKLPGKIFFQIKSVHKVT